MIIEQTLSFKKDVKKLHKNRKIDLDKAVKNIVDNPYIGRQKTGDLSDVMVFKFRMQGVLTLLAYKLLLDKDRSIIRLLRLGSHENFYRDLKK